MIIDATNLIAGRMATVVAKKVLQGETVDIINVEKKSSILREMFGSLKFSKTPEKLYSIEVLSIKSNNVVLSANYYKQQAKGKHPALVLLHGSSTNLKSDYVFDADFFARRGFEVLIFDKRGNGKSTGDYYTSNYDDLIEDAIVCLEILNERESVDKSKIGLWGYSQGAMLLSKIITKTDIPSFLGITISNKSTSGFVLVLFY